MGSPILLRTTKYSLPDLYMPFLYSVTCVKFRKLCDCAAKIVAFWYLMSEAIGSFNLLFARLQTRLEDPRRGSQVRKRSLSSRDELLLAIIWLRQYPTYIYMSQMFNIWLQVNLYCYLWPERLLYNIPSIQFEVKWHNTIVFIYIYELI